MHAMNLCLKKIVALLVLLVGMLADTAAEAVTSFSSGSTEKRSAAAFSFDSVWFYRDGIRVVPEISGSWLTVVLKPGDNSVEADSGSTADSFIQEKADAIIKANDLLTEYLYDPNIAEDACFFKMRTGLKPADRMRLISRLNRNPAVDYVHPTLVLNNKTFAYFTVFQLEWKTGVDEARRGALLNAVHTVSDENDEKGSRYIVDVAKIPFFRALNLLAEDINVLRATPYLVEIRQSISAELRMPMNGGNIGDSLPFTLTIAFSDQVNIDPSSLSTLNLRPSNLQKELFDSTFDPYDYAKAVTKSPIVITGQLKVYAPGEFAIPSIPISYSCPSCSSGTVRTLDTEPVLIKIASIIPAEQPRKRLIVPTDAAPPDFHLAALRGQSEQYRRLAISCFSGLAVCVVWLLFLCCRRLIQRRRLPGEKMDSALAEQLRTLLDAAPTSPHWSCLAETGALLRRYLVARYGIDAKYAGGSGKQFMETVGEHVPQEFAGPLRTIFEAIDDCVSLESEQCPDIEQLRSDILKIVDVTAHNRAAHR